MSPANDALWFSGDHEYLIVYALDKATWRPNRLKKTGEQLKYYKNPDDDPRGVWNSGAYTCAKSADERPNLYYSIENPNTGAGVWPKKTRVWAFSPDTHAENEERGLVYWGKDGRSSKPRFKKFLRDKDRVVPRSVWSYSDVGHTQQSMMESLALFDYERFPTPKPERLISRVLEVGSSEGDIVLDSFLGSGTTAAVAQKMNRRYLGIELGDHAVTHCTPRIKKVIDGEGGGISDTLGWRGGGGFRFYRLGSPIFDELGSIYPDIQFLVLAAHVWFSETDTPWNGTEGSPLLGLHNGRAYVLLYNGVLGDKTINGGNVLTRVTLRTIRAGIAKTDPNFGGSLTVYGERTAMGETTLIREGITFKQTPYDVKARR